MQRRFGERGLQGASLWLRKLGLVTGLSMAVLGANAAVQHPDQEVPRARQGQTAYRFLRAVLQAEYQFAYQFLAPEVRKAVSLQHFQAAAEPLRISGQRHGTAIELYKLGMRFSDGEASRHFYSFSFAADTGSKTPSQLLEVTFRDTASRAVLGFGLQRPSMPGKATPKIISTRPGISAPGKGAASKKGTAHTRAAGN